MRIKSSLLTFLFALSVGAPSFATSYVMVSDDALVDSSPLAVVGRVTAVDRGAMVAGPHGPALRTEYTVAVEQSLKGQAPAGTLAVRVPGGVQPNGIGLRIYGAPRFAVGERVLLFLESDRRGAFRPMHLMLGAFHEARAGERSLALRNLSEASEMQVTPDGLAPAPPRQEPLRDFAAFARWIKARAEGVQAPADYLVTRQDGTIGQVTAPFSTFEDPTDHLKLRWFDFDTGGHISFRALSTGEDGIADGGYSEFQTGLQTWNAETQTPIDYRYAGTTESTNGLSHYDTVNSIVFNDPEGELTAFSCTLGGVLGQGGPWYDGDTVLTFRGTSYHPIANADVVINSNLACFFAHSPDASKAAQELFTHELGHTLGLGHSCGDANGPDPAECTDPALNDAIMRAFIHDDGRGAHLGSDDLAGIRSLYQQASSGGTPPAAPTGLTAAATSTSAVHLTWVDHANNETEFRIEAKPLDGSFAEVGTAPANTAAANVTGLSPATGYMFRVRAHNATGFSAYSNQATATTNGSTAPCVADNQTLCLNGGRFRVNLDWLNAGQTAHAQVVPVTSTDSGLYFFQDPDNWEMLIKVLNGCTLAPPHYWVFFAATTDVQFTVTVTDTQTGAARAYFNPLHHSASAVTDTSAFATCP